MQNQFYWDAFWDLGSERSISMGVGPIPRSAVRDYAREFAVTGDAYDVFLTIIRKLDCKYLELNSSSNKTQNRGLVAPADDPEKAAAVMDVIRARAAAAKKKQRKQRVH
jgi:hypothetical protein